MSRCLTRVAEILGLAESKKITDRRNFIKALQEVYLSEEYIEAINDGTSRDVKGSVSWNQIMLAIHHVVVTETEKVVSKSTKGNTSAILQSGCCDLMKKTVNHAISTRVMSLSCGDFMAMIFQIFGKSAYEFCYDTYIGILLSILANRTYRSAMNLEQWREVLKLVQRIYFQSRSDIRGVLLDTARMVVHYGCLQSHLTLDVKQILPFLEQVFRESVSDRETKKKPLYKLTYAVCQQIGTESRVALCEFSEKILPTVITVEGCQEKYTMTLLLIRIHHPGGAVTSDDGAYACDWEQWKNIIRGIYASIGRDMKPDKMPPCFLELAAEVYRLAMMDHSYISNATSTCTDSDDMQPRKRRRLSMAVRKPVDMLLDNDLEVTWMSLQVLTILLSKYPDTLKLDEYEIFLKTVTELVTTSLNNEKIMDRLCELCTVLVNAEKKHWHDAEAAEGVRICWEKIWDTILRALSMNQNEKYGHALLQSIIAKRGAVNPHGILRLYLTNAIRWSCSSVKSLLIFCDYTPIPDELVWTGAASSSKPEGSTRISLLQWSLDMPPVKQSSQGAFLELANLLTALVVRSWHEHEFRDFRKSQELEHQRKIQSRASMRKDLFDDREKKYFNDIERCSLSLNFRSNDTELVDDESRRETETKPRIFHVQDALERLTVALNSLIGDRAIAEDLETTVTRLTVTAKVLSNFLELNIRSEPQTSKLVNTFGQHFQKVCSHIVTNQKTLKFDSLVRVIEALEILYTTRYNREVAQILSTLSSMDFLKFIFDLSEDHGDSDDEDDENSQSFDNVHGNRLRKVSDKYFNVSVERSRGCRLRNSAYKILTYFCCTPIGDKMLDAQIRVLRNLMKISLYENTSNADLRCALEVLKTYGMFGQLLESGEESLEIANNFIRQLFHSRLKEETAVRGILNVLPHFLEASTRFIRETEKILEILRTIKKRLAKKCYGPRVLGDFVKCIAAIARTNPSLTWGASSSVESSPIVDVLVDYIDNPFYLVRIEVVRALHDVFASKDLQVPAKADFFTKIESTMPQLFSTDEISNDCEKMDERETRTLTAVQIYAAILRANEYLSSRALYSMIKLSVRRDVKVKTIERALLHVTKTEEDQRRLIELNLHDLLSRWFEDNYPLQLFPWTLAHCESQEDFSRRHIDTLLSIKLQRCEFQQLTTLCNNLEVSFAKTVEDCFPTIMTQLVSMIVQDSSEDGAPERVAYAKEIYAKLCRNVGEYESVTSFDALLKEKLSDVLIHLVQRLRDDEHFFEMFSRRVFLPAMNPPNLTVETIDRCLGFLEKVLRVEKNCLVEYLVARCPSILQRVYETLFCNVNAIDCRDRKLQAFHQYRYFGTIVLREVQKSCFDPMSFYIVRDTSYSLLSLTRDETLAEMACDYFYEFLRDSMPGRSREIKEVLSFVVSTLVPIARSSTGHGAMKILEFLIIEQREWLGDAIEKLDSFPNVESFAAIRRVHDSLKYGGAKSYSLEDEIEHFLNATNAKTLSCSHEGLAHVKNQLAARKEELRAMYDGLEGLRGFAEDCASSTLHKLIYKLVQLTRSCDTNISLEAAKCLGELGPADLTTMILHAENVYAKEDDDDVAMLAFRVISQLIDYLVDNNTSLRRASSSALYEIFATSWGNDLARDSNRGNDRTIYHYVYPFVNRAQSSRRSSVFRVNYGNWKSCIDPANDLWIPTTRKTHDRWIIDLTCKLLDCFVDLYTPCLKPVCRESVEFCEILLPRLVNLIRSLDSRFVNDVCLCINRFFLGVYEALGEADISMTISESPAKNGDAALSHECVRSMINVVNFMRIQTSDNAPLCLDYLYIAKAAQYCSAYFTSVLYAELWCQYLLQSSRLLQDKVPGSWISPIDCICESKPEPGRLLQSIVREAYLQIGDPDSIYGCGSAHLIDSSYRVQHWIHLRQWDKVTLAQDVEVSSGNASTRGMLYALQQSGLHSLMGRVIGTSNQEQENVDDFTYEAAWRLADWSIVESRRSNENSDSCPIARSNDYHSSHYRALKCLRDADFLGSKTHLDDARTSLIVSLRKISLECGRTVYPILSQLRMLREIEDFASFVADGGGEALAKWRRDDCLVGHDFQWIEPILSQRLVMHRNAGRSSDFTDRALIETHLGMAKIAEKQGYLAHAARALDVLSRQNLTSSARDELTYQEACLAWKRNDRDIGRYLLRNLLKKSNLSAGLRAKALNVYGNWMAVTKSENPRAVIEKYYEESIKTSVAIANKSTRDTKNLTGAQADLAQFADAQYQQIVEFTQSAQYESLRECTKLKNVGSGQPIPGRGTDERKAIMTYQKQMTNDAAELERLQREKETYLALAARYYLMTLQSGDEHDLLLFRLVSLWLDNMYNEALNEILDEQLRSVASYKFIVLLPQLAPHMSNDVNVFTTKIHDLMKRCAEEHPHHTLPVLLALKNTHKDEEFNPTEKGTQQRRTGYVEPRVLAAEALISSLVNSPIRTMIREMSDLSNALVALAYFTGTEAQARKKVAAHVIPKTQPITKIRNYANVCVPTLTVPVRPGRNYDDVVGVREYVANFDLPGGANAPKKVVCVGTDGVRRTQLVKGKDDLRQDAVMQQVCTVMNDMLRTSKETKKRKLHIRTYKIVPLSRRSGILEWCENTLPISHVLCDVGDKRGMHAKYYPDDWSVAKCRAKLYAVDKSSTEIRHEIFLECCRNLHPAFHHFFMEKYPSAETWFERRLAYVRSVATTSMVGYMLGLGDRHFSNILIDQTTAEVIHIDFGIAFAQGMALPIPETVPFRLTRDMEVAMGICGVEGVMRRSCEETITVLRDRRKILITLLQVLLYDPLFSWALTPALSDAVENLSGRRYSGKFADERGERKTNKVAERALLKIEQKLQGTEDGISSSISGQVERLIQQARDPMNLCRLYSGWQPYL